MSKSGGKVVKSLGVSFMGFYEILINIFTVLKTFLFVKKISNFSIQIK